MIWPATLVNVSLYNTLHEHKVLTRWFTRMQLFWYAFFAIFLYQWLPKMFMPVLTSMALLCWIKPSSNVLRKLGSGYVGLGMGCISLDWSIISGVGPLYTPWVRLFCLFFLPSANVFDTYHRILTQRVSLVALNSGPRPTFS